MAEKHLGDILTSRWDRFMARFSHARWHLGCAWAEVRDAFRSLFGTHPWDAFNKTFVPSGFPGHTMVQRFEDPTLGTVTKEGGDTPGKGVPLCPICDQPIGNCEHLG